MANPLENFQAITLHKPMTVNVPYFPEAGIVAKEGEKIVVRIPEGTLVYISIKGPKASYAPVPVPTLQSQPAPAPPPQHLPAAVHQAKGSGKVAYKPKAAQPGNNAGASTKNASAANGGGVANGHQGSGRSRGGSERSHENRNPASSRNNSAVAVAAGVKVVTAEELKRQREEQAANEAWLQQRKELQRKEREEQDRRYRERIERQKKAEEEAEARRKKALQAAGLLAAGDPLPEGEKGEKETGETVRRACWVCDSDKHISRKCPLRCKRSTCNGFGQEQHASKDCKVKCALCTGKGHDEWFCDRRCKMCSRGTGDAHLPQQCPIECGLCGGKGHRERECSYSYQNRHATVN